MTFQSFRLTHLTGVMQISIPAIPDKARGGGDSSEWVRPFGVAVSRYTCALVRERQQEHHTAGSV